MGDDGVGKQFTQLLTFIVAFFDNLDLNAGVAQHLGQMHGNAAAADQHDGADAGLFKLKHLDQRDQVVGGRGDVHDVAGLEHKAAVGDDNIALALHGTDEHADFQRLVQLGQRHAVQLAVFMHGNGDDLRAALGEGFALGKGGEFEQTEDFARGDLFGINAHAQSQLVAQQVLGFQILAVAHAGDGMLAAELARYHAAKEVGFIRRGDGDEQIGCGYAGLALQCGAGAIAFHNHDVQMIRRLAECAALAVDDHQIMSFAAERLGKGKADFAVADNHNLHRNYSCWRNSILCK